jgi:prolipoprotein diacylglyceryltransferase
MEGWKDANNVHRRVITVRLAFTIVMYMVITSVPTRYLAGRIGNFSTIEDGET